MTIFTYLVCHILKQLLRNGFYKICSGGLSEPEDGGGENDAALYNRKECYKNLDPSQGYEWVLHGNLLRPRAAHQTAVLDGQLHHIAGYAKGNFNGISFFQIECIFQIIPRNQQS